MRRDNPVKSGTFGLASIRIELSLRSLPLDCKIKPRACDPGRSYLQGRLCKQVYTNWLQRRPTRLMPMSRAVEALMCAGASTQAAALERNRR